MNLLTYLHLDTAAFEAGARRARQALMTVGTAGIDTAAATNAAAGSMGDLADSTEKLAAASSVTSALMVTSGGAAAGMGAAIARASDPAPLDGLAQSARAAGAALADAAAHGKTFEMSLLGTKNGKEVWGNKGDDEGLRKIKPAADNAVAGLNAVSAANGLLSGTAMGTASGTIALSAALKGLGLAAAGTVALAVGLVAALAFLAKTIIDVRTQAARLPESIKLGNAEAGVESLRRAYARLIETMDGAVGLMRELRALTREDDDIDADKRLAQIDNDRKRELAALKPGDEDGAREVNSRYDRLRGNAELDREAARNAAAAAEARRQREENAAAIAARRERYGQLAAEGSAATNRASDFDSRPAFLNSTREYNNEMAEKWRGVAKGKLDDAERIRAEIEELERKNRVLDEQARIYEKRNEVVDIRREGLAIADPARKEKDEKEKGDGGLKVDADRLTRIGGYMLPGAGGGNKLETLNERQLDELKLMRAAVDKMSRDGIAGTWWE